LLFLGHELLLAQRGLPLRELGLRSDHVALGIGLGQRPGLRGLRLRLVDLCLRGRCRP